MYSITASKNRHSENMKSNRFIIAKRRILKNYDLYLLFIPTLAYFLIFHYGPMYGLQIAFKDFISIKGITESPWVGFKHFERFFNSYQAWPVIRNTLILSFYNLLAGFPAPIILALLLNQTNNRYFKKLVQNITYAPHFISIVVIVGMMRIFLSPSTGLVNEIIDFFGGERVFFLANVDYFKHLFVLSAIWQNTGYSAIIYLATLSSINISLYEASIADGASKIQRIWYIDIPGILPTAAILLILQAGRVMQLGFQKAFLMQNPLNLEASEIISTYVYKTGLLAAQYSFSTAVEFFKSVVNLALVLTVNYISKALRQSTLW